MVVADLVSLNWGNGGLVGAMVGDEPGSLDGMEEMV